MAIALALGAVALQRPGRRVFAALQRLDASLLSLLLYMFPPRTQSFNPLEGESNDDA